MENAAFELHQALSAENDVTLVKWGGSNLVLPFVYTWMFLQALWFGWTDRPDVIYLQDGIMASMGWLLKGLLRRPTLLTIHGREATYGLFLYKLMVTPFIPRQSQLVAVSKETKTMVEKALPGTHPLLIHNGLRDGFYSPRPRLDHLKVIARETNVPLDELTRSKLLHTNGRLVRRKGVLWFVENVLPKLVKAKSPVLYFVTGEGRDRQAIEAAAARLGLEAHVLLLGRASDELRDALYNAANIFVMPNVHVPNDMEGFGLVALEAASCGTMVVASKLEGIQDAIIDKQNGLLLKPGDAAACVRTIKRELKKRSIPATKVRAYTLEHYSWSKTAWQYEVLMRKLVR